MDAIQLCASDVLEQACAWTCVSRADRGHNHSIYESIDHGILLVALRQYVSCPILLNLVTQYCQQVEIKDGHYYHIKKGIPKGCPLSPLVAALYLKPLDDELSKHGFYQRFMDDWLIMVNTKHQLRKVIKLTHKILNAVQLKMHPDKTYLGRIKKGFDFLGVHFSAVPRIAKATVEKHQVKLALALCARYKSCLHWRL